MRRTACHRRTNPQAVRRALSRNQSRTAATVRAQQKEIRSSTLEGCRAAGKLLGAELVFRHADTNHTPQEALDAPIPGPPEGTKYQMVNRHSEQRNPAASGDFQLWVR